MFTGIVEGLGEVTRLAPDGAVVRLRLATALDLADTRVGDSIAIDGVCLTVTRTQSEARWTVDFDVGPESLHVTALSRLRPGAMVHLERALRLSDRLGGHLMQGHVDGVGHITHREMEGDTCKLHVALPPDLLPLCIPKGSIALSGVSLTINSIDETGVGVWLIPHTLQGTHLGERKLNDPLNVEADMIGKYVRRLLSLEPDAPKGVTWDLLQRAGFLHSE